MLGASMGLGCAAIFGMNQIVARRSVMRASVSYVANISILSGPLFFALMALLVGELPRMGQFTWQAHMFFAAAGVVHFALGRTFGYRSLQLIGATRTNLVTGLSAVVSVGLAIALLNERFTVLTALGFTLSVIGPLLMGLKEGDRKGNPIAPRDEGKHIDRRTLWLGIFFGLGAAVLWGSSAVLIKLGLDHGGSPVAGSLVSYVAASLAICPSLLKRSTRRELFASSGATFRLALISGMTTNISQFLRIMALNYTTVITLSLVTRTVPLWVLLMAFLASRGQESFSKWVLTGNAFLLTGTVLVLL